MIVTLNVRQSSSSSTTNTAIELICYLNLVDAKKRATVQNDCFKKL